ncbi:MAG: nuclear transport factor 2 family protein [Flavobacteriaceae bacterium]|nr:nuclear transport factor 2 family protein [Flavobacteriaceae bacterium]
MNKILYSLLLLLLCSACDLQKDSSDKELIATQTQSLDNALMQKDTLTLNALLHKELSLGHSNGWLETKPDLLTTLIDEGVLYTSIKTIGKPKIHYSSQKLRTTRRNIDVSGIVNETPFDVKLNVLEVWILENNQWQLLARQSVNRKE